MKRMVVYKTFFTTTVLFIFLQGLSQSSKQEMQNLVDENLQLAVKQYKYMQQECIAELIQKVLQFLPASSLCTVRL